MDEKHNTHFQFILSRQPSLSARHTSSLGATTPTQATHPWQKLLLYSPIECSLIHCLLAVNSEAEGKHTKNNTEWKKTKNFHTEPQLSLLVVGLEEEKGKKCAINYDNK